jgi:hypothetical protein
MGLLMEVVSPTSHLFMRAEFPHDAQDVKLMAVEEAYSDATSPEELYEMLRDVHPICGDVLRPATADDLVGGHGTDVAGVYRVRDEVKEALASQKDFPWHVAFKLAQQNFRP